LWFAPQHGSVQFFQQGLNSVKMQEDCSWGDCEAGSHFFNDTKGISCVDLCFQLESSVLYWDQRYTVILLHYLAKETSNLQLLQKYLLKYRIVIPDNAWQAFCNETWLFKKSIQIFLQRLLRDALYFNDEHLVKWTIRQGVSIQASMFQSCSMWACYMDPD
jgi:hypothetical protein